MDVNRPGPLPESIDALESELRIAWRDGTTLRHTYHLVRRSCRCARCVEELTGRALLDPDTIPDDIHPVAIHRIGHYAVRIVWSDGHDSGIFPFTHLRSLPATGGRSADSDL